MEFEAKGRQTCFVEFIFNSLDVDEKKNKNKLLIADANSDFFLPLMYMYDD